MKRKPTHTKKGEPKITHRSGSGRFKAEPKGSGPEVGKKPIAPAELDQDPGGGYNPGGVDPQT